MRINTKHNNSNENGSVYLSRIIESVKYTSDFYKFSIFLIVFTTTFRTHAQTGTSGDPFTSLDQAAAVKLAGVYYFNIGGTTFDTYINEEGYVMIAIDFGSGTTTLTQGTSLTTAARGILNTTVLATLTETQEVRITSSTSNVDVISTNAPIIARIQSNTTLHQGVADNAINDSWTGTGSGTFSPNASCTTGSGTGLHQNIFHPCGNAATFNWIPNGGYMRELWTSGEVSDAVYFQLWVKGTEQALPTGPGGVGSNDGSSTLEFWLNASQGTSTTTDDADISQWDDQSGNSVDVAQGTASKQPSYEDDGTNAMNGHPVVHFDGDDELVTSSSTSLNISNDFTVFMVKEDNTTQPGANSSYLSVATTGGTGILVYRGDGTNDKFIVKASGAFTSDWISTSGVTNDAVYIGEYKRSGTTMYLSRFGDAYISDVGTAGPIEFGATPQVQIGNDANNWYLQGNIGEMIVFSRAVNTAEKIVIENYLAAKYGTSLLSNDVFAQDNPGNGNYDYDVAGIGRVDASNLIDDAQGTGIIRVLNPSNLGDDEFLSWGHNNGALEATETTDINAGDGIEARLERVWRVSEVNASGSAVDVGTIDIRFNLSGLGSITASDLRLIIDTDNDGLFSDETAITGAVTFGGSIYEFSDVSSITDGLSFTLGTIDIGQTPLPVQLLDFDLTKLDNRAVELIWHTASECNNDFFTIERSKDGKYWNRLKDVDGAGNSSVLHTYKEIDTDPFTGISYYRLKQTDFNGAYAYSEVKGILLDAQAIDMTVFPNPASNKINIVLAEEGEAEFRIYSNLGEIVLQGHLNGTGQLDISSIDSGLYQLLVVTKNGSYSSTLLIEE